MTTPISTGYPDYGRQASEAQVLEISDIGVNIPHNFNYPIKYVGNAKSLQLWANPPFHGMRLQFQFFGDANGLVIMDSYVVNMLAGDVAKGPIPIMGPYLRVVVQHADAATNQVTIELWRTPEAARFAGLESDVAVLSTVGQAIGAGANANVDCLNVMEGQAYWTAYSAAAGWQVLIEFIDFLGAVTYLDLGIGSAQSLLHHSVYLPPGHIRGNFTNSSGAASTFTLIMTRRHNN